MSDLFLYDSSITANRIKKQAKVQGITIKELLAKCQLGINTVSKLSLGTDIYSKNLAKIADCLDCSVDYLLGRTDISKLFIQYNTESKRNEKKYDSTEKTIILPFYRTPSSAGTGTILFDEIPVEYMNVPKTIETADADFMVEIRGDSMIPKFNNGDIILVKQSESIYENEIGLFILNGESFVKKMGKGCLISLNSAYSPIEIREFDSVRCAGKVIGTVKLN